MKREIPALDGIRGLAIALVIWSHLPGAPLLLSLFSGYGGFGVELFFALSGFLLFLPYGRAFAHTTTWPSVKRFYRQRARRILPMYALVLLGIILTLLHNGILRTQIVPFSFVALFLLDMRLDAWNLMSLRDGAIWSLAPEWQFYLLLPLIALGLRALHRWRGVQGLVLGLLGLMVYGLTVRGISAVAHYAWGWPNPILPLIYGMKGKYLEVFAVGMLGATIYTHLIERKRLTSAIQSILGRWSFILACLGFALCLAWAIRAERLPNVGNVSIWAPLPAWTIAGEWFFGVCSVLLILGALIGPARRVFEWMPLRRLGHISYSLFLIHSPVIALLSPLSFRLTASLGWPGYLIFGILSVAPSLLIATLTYRLVEQPFLGRGVPFAVFKPSPAIEKT